MNNRLNLTLQKAVSAQNLPTRADCQRWISTALQQSAEITVRLVDEQEARQLNQQFRQRNYTPNVLTFPLAEKPLLVGDIVLCVPVVEHEARQQNKNLQAHYAHLIIHGTLHLQGYDHHTDPEANMMEALETRLMQQLGYPDPYYIPEPAHE